MKGSTTMAVGIDVGGARKGLHAIALRGRDVIDAVKDTNAPTLARWCEEIRASAVAIDAPARSPLNRRSTLIKSPKRHVLDSGWRARMGA